MDSACLGLDDCGEQADIDTHECQPLIIGGQRLPLKDRCNRKTLPSALMNFAGAWSKSKTSFAAQHAPTRKMQFLAPVPAGIPNGWSRRSGGRSRAGIANGNVLASF
jgi:hypothetical protein